MAPSAWYWPSRLLMYCVVSFPQPFLSSPSSTCSDVCLSVSVIVVQFLAAISIKAYHPETLRLCGSAHVFRAVFSESLLYYRHRALCFLLQGLTGALLTGDSTSKFKRFANNERFLGNIAMLPFLEQTLPPKFPVLNGLVLVSCCRKDSCEKPNANFASHNRSI